MNEHILKNNKPLKIIAFVLLIISFIPLLYTIGLCIYNGIVGLPVPDSDTIYGLKAFLGTLFASFITTWYVYILALVLTIVSIYKRCKVTFVQFAKISHFALIFNKKSSSGTELLSLI